ncbi:putative methyltransferase PMT13 [Camellia lanceoleosa]|uniref:Methyltransferase PMT13 n=1 Tax=Camellia lanceoleosa TaxID=1840588 RepID=A0ACC0I255_9ERIC|nr:putative methyltransferase PMT13 [Camellia lanceoleosa]
MMAITPTQFLPEQHRVGDSFAPSSVVNVVVIEDLRVTILRQASDLCGHLDLTISLLNMYFGTIFWFPFVLISPILEKCLCMIKNAKDATYFIEVGRLLTRGYIVISPPYKSLNKIRNGQISAKARALCYELIVVDGNTVIWKKPNGDSCLPNQNEFGLELCAESDDPNRAL